MAWCCSRSVFKWSWEKTVWEKWRERKNRENQRKNEENEKESFSAHHNMLYCRKKSVQRGRKLTVANWIATKDIHVYVDSKGEKVAGRDRKSQKKVWLISCSINIHKVNKAHLFLDLFSQFLVVNVHARQLDRTSQHTDIPPSSQHHKKTSHLLIPLRQQLDVNTAKAHTNFTLPSVCIISLVVESDSLNHLIIIVCLFLAKKRS